MIEYEYRMRGWRGAASQLDGHAAGADDVGAVEQEAEADKRHVAPAADETLVVPVSVVERRELRRRRTCPRTRHTISRRSTHRRRAATHGSFDARCRQCSSHLTHRVK